MAGIKEKINLSDTLRFVEGTTVVNERNPSYSSGDSAINPTGGSPAGGSASGGSSGSGSLPANFASSPYGDLEISKYLYQTGLQNIFNDYQKNIGTLDAEKQKQVQDAYFIREMSKKYLGEYASNLNIGDVSGNLIDIYSNYQKNKNEIEGNFSALELNLEREYQTAKTDLVNNILATEYQIEVAKMDQAAQDVAFKIQTNDTGGMSALDFIKANRASMSDANFKALYGAYYQAEQNEAPKVTNLTSSGNYDVLKEYTGNEKVDKNSSAYEIDGDPNTYFQVKKPVDKDKDNPHDVEPETLFSEFETNEKYLGQVLKEDTIIDYRGIYYVYKGGEFYRLVSQFTNKQPQQSTSTNGSGSWEKASDKPISTYKSSGNYTNGATMPDNSGGTLIFFDGYWYPAKQK